MSDVTLAVGGRNYTVSCADGQEDRLGNQLERMAIALENAASTLEGSGSTS